MGVVEVVEEAVVQDETAGDPQSHHWTIPLKVDQELEPSSSSTNVQDALDCVGKTPIQNMGEGGGSKRGTRSGSATSLNLDMWNVGCILNAGGSFRQTAARFTIQAHLEWEVLCGQPDFLTWLI